MTDKTMCKECAEVAAGICDGLESEWYDAGHHEAAQAANTIAHDIRASATDGDYVRVPREPTEAMWMAYRYAIGDTIKAAVAAGTAESMWSKKSCGYRMTGRQKCMARYKAMLAAHAAQINDGTAQVGQDGQGRRANSDQQSADEGSHPQQPTTQPASAPSPVEQLPTGQTGGERRQGHSALRGRPLDENGGAELETFDPHPATPAPAGMPEEPVYKNGYWYFGKDAWLNPLTAWQYYAIALRAHAAAETKRAEELADENEVLAEKATGLATAFSDMQSRAESEHAARVAAERALEEMREAAAKVTWFDYSTCDSDVERAIEGLRAAQHNLAAAKQKEPRT